MNKILLAVGVALFSISAANAQFYVSASTGYSFSAARTKMGTETTPNGVENTYGSYGEGSHTQLRAGYFFNEKWGVEVATGYLHGADHTLVLLDVPAQPSIDVKARGRAYGFSVSSIYNISKNFYGRAGIVTKIAGKTEVVGNFKTALPAVLVNPAAPATATVPLEIDFTRDFNGRFPLGVIGAIGYKSTVAKNLAVFAEIEYLGLSITRDTSEIGDFSATLGGASVSRKDLLSTAGAALGPIGALINDKISYEDSLTLLENAQAEANPLARKQLSQTAPYSSWGFNIGLTYTFAKKSKQ